MVEVTDNETKDKIRQAIIKEQPELESLIPPVESDDEKEEILVQFNEDQELDEADIADAIVNLANAMAFGNDKVEDIEVSAAVDAPTEEDNTIVVTNDNPNINSQGDELLAKFGISIEDFDEN